MRSRARPFLLGLLLWGCAEQPAARWLELTDTGPAQVEPGGTLNIESSGLPSGRPCDVALRGRTFRPGLPPFDVAARLQGRAVSDTQAAVALTARELGLLGGHGSFEGEIELSFAARDGEGRVSGSRPLRLDISWPLARGAQHEQRVRAQAQRLLGFAGIAIGDEASLQSGLLVRTLRAGSVARAIGLREGDVIVRASGVSVHALSDLAPPPAVAGLPLVIERKGAQLALHVPLLGFRAPDLGEEAGRAAALLAWLFTCALLLGPWPSGAEWLRGVASRVRRAPSGVLALWGGNVAPRPASLRAALLAYAWPVALSVLGALLVWLEPAGFLAVRSLSLYLGLCAVSVTLTLLSDAGTRAERLRAALAVVGRMAVMGVLIACACALFGTRTFDGMVVGQGAEPWRWALFQKPALFIAFPLYLVFASRLGATTLALEARGPASQLLVLERVLTNVALCALGVAIFAGGWQHPPELLSRFPLLEALDPRLCGALIYVCKTWCFALLISTARRIGFGDALRRRSIAAACTVVIALTALWLWLAPSAVFELALGHAACTSAASVALIAAVRTLVQRLRTGSLATVRGEPVATIPTALAAAPREGR